GARRRAAAAEAAAHRQRLRHVHRRGASRSDRPLPCPRRSAPRIGTARHRRPLDVRRRRRSRVHRSPVERRMAAPRGAQFRRTLRSRCRGVENSGVAERSGPAKRDARAARSVARAVGVRGGRRAAVRGVDASQALGAAMTLRSVAVTVCLVLALASSAVAGERYALVVTGASGGDVYAKKYDGWRQAFVNTLRDTFGYAQDHVFVLAETERDGVRKATRENVRSVLGELRRRVAKDDQLIVLLIGHGTSMDGEEAKFNLVGPDLSATEWAELLRPILGRLVFVNTSSASFPFLRKLAGKGRIVLTATDSSAQQFETVFPEFFIKALTDPAADLDKNGRVSVWEAF